MKDRLKLRDLFALARCYLLVLLACQAGCRITKEFDSPAGSGRPIWERTEIEFTWPIVAASGAAAC